MRILQHRTFSGGVHPPQNKLTARLPIEDIVPPPMVVIPLQQHLGAPAEPVCQVGDMVKIGDKIGEAKGFVSVPCHASVSGTVKAVEPRLHPLGGKVLSVVIENDGKGEVSPSLVPDDGYLERSPDELRSRIREAGLAGMGGAAFPTHVKLSPPANKPIDTLIINGAECEPYLTSDHRLMLEHPREILAGVQVIVKILGCKRCFIAIEDNKPDAIETMRRAVAEGGYPYQVLPFRAKYPQGAEKQLIKAATGREVPRGGLPMDVGCLVHNVGTAKAIYEAVALRKPLVERVVTVTGAGVRSPKNLRVPLGTPFAHLFAQCGGLSEDAGKIIMGGPMMGIAQFSDEVPVIKGTSGVVVLSKAESKVPAPHPCIGCARCVDACPMKLVPTHIQTLVRHERFGMAKTYGLLDCIECGCCGFVCPAGIPFVHLMKYGKMKVYQLERAAGAKSA
ncbi:MAG: electron transport complex subunit RsxC [candidate division KSB1 bacterium]|nr:electron transport complex subunit RsxC [candidate division KSB1 bacterium]MDZ7392816.1 electron transport complex subunit RsxC [candidate division KSB1 bacterium]